MKYRTKIILALLLAVFFSNLIAAAILYKDTQKIVYAELQSKVISIVATTAAFLDAELIKKFRENPQETNLSYIELRKILLDAVNANKRKDLRVSILYIFRKPENQPENIIIEIDTKSQEERYKSGHSLVRNQKFLDEQKFLQLGDYRVTKNYYKNVFGTWLTAYAPTKDETGEVVGYVGINVRSSNIIKYLQQILIYCGLSLLFSLVASFLLALFLAKKFSRPLSSLCHTVDEIGSGNLWARSEYKEEDEFGELGKEIDKMADGLEEKERVKGIFARYVSKEVLEIILKGEEKAKLEGERKKITVLFSDLRGFSKISEQLPPEEVVLLLNQYFKKMIEIIFQYRGTLDKILGDGLLVLFGAPLDDEKQEVNALKTALDMQKELKNLCSQWENEGKPTLNMGIGIHTGNAIVGNIGSEKHLEYTAIGLTVNFAYRLEQSTKKYQCPILLSQSVADALENVPLKKHGSLEIKGKDTGIDVYSLEEGYEHLE